MTFPNSRSLQVLVISGNTNMRRSIELTLRCADISIIGSDSLLVFLARWKGESRLLDAMILEVGETDPATVGRIQILASIPELPQTLLVASAETIHLLDNVRKRPEVDVLVEPFSAFQLVKAVQELANKRISSFGGGHS